MITTTVKTELKLKKVCFDGDKLIDMDEQEVNLIDQLKVAFSNAEFDLVACVTAKSEYNPAENAD